MDGFLDLPVDVEDGNSADRNIDDNDREMNPIEPIWKELRKRGFRNDVFDSLDQVVDRLCDTICSLSPDTISHITARSWILSCFY